MVTRSGSGAEQPPGRGPGDEAAAPGAGPAGEERDREWRRVLWSLSTGLYVLGSTAGARRNLMTASWVTQVAAEPRRVGVGVERGSVTLVLLRDGGVFALSLLAVEDRALVRRFVRPVPAEETVVDAAGTGTMRQVPVRSLTTGAPVLVAAVAWIDCEVAEIVDLGSHSWVVGTVVAAGFAPDGEGRPVLTMGDTRMSYGG